MYHIIISIFQGPVTLPIFNVEPQNLVSEGILTFLLTLYGLGGCFPQGWSIVANTFGSNKRTQSKLGDCPKI